MFFIAYLEYFNCFLLIYHHSLFFFLFFTFSKLYDSDPLKMQIWSFHFYKYHKEDECWSTWNCKIVTITPPAPQWQADESSPYQALKGPTTCYIILILMANIIPVLQKLIFIEDHWLAQGKIDSKQICFQVHLWPFHQITTHLNRSKSFFLYP